MEILFGMDDMWAVAEKSKKNKGIARRMALEMVLAVDAVQRQWWLSVEVKHSARITSYHVGPDNLKLFSLSAFITRFFSRLSLSLFFRYFRFDQFFFEGSFISENKWKAQRAYENKIE